jgi:malonyl-CoA O-methyltransferase
MNSVKSKFEFIPRGFGDTAVLVPGWASDCRIFTALDLPYNYLLPIKFSFSDFEKGLLEALQQNSVKKAHLLGWSLGGFLAAQFAGKNHSRVKELVLLSIAREFDNNLLKEIAGKIKKNKRAYLYKFYRDCFSPEDRTGWCWFKKNLLKDYIHTMELGDLIAGLEYLSLARLTPAEASRVDKIRIFHGEEDRILPFSDAASIRSEFRQADFTPLSGIGHICFLNSRFKEKFYHG